jgi:hypothetical protein
MSDTRYYSSLYYPSDREELIAQCVTLKETCREKDAYINELLARLDKAGGDGANDKITIARLDARRVELIQRCNKHYADENSLRYDLANMKDQCVGHQMQTDVAEAQAARMEVDATAAMERCHLYVKEKKDTCQYIEKLNVIRVEQMDRARDAECEVIRLEGSLEDLQAVVDNVSAENSSLLRLLRMYDPEL